MKLPAQRTISCWFQAKSAPPNAPPLCRSGKVLRVISTAVQLRGSGEDGPNEEPSGTAVPANSYWTKGQSDITADDAGMAMLKAISAAA